MSKNIVINWRMVFQYKEHFVQWKVSNSQMFEPCSFIWPDEDWRIQFLPMFCFCFVFLSPDGFGFLSTIAFGLLSWVSKDTSYSVILSLLVTVKWVQSLNWIGMNGDTVKLLYRWIKFDRHWTGLNQLTWAE